VKEKRSMGLNIGSASIIMLFVVLALTVLSALSLLSSSSQLRLAQRAADVVTDYYAADLEASAIYEGVQAGDLSLVDITSGGDDVYIYSYLVKIDEHQSLDVALRDANGEITVQKWKIIESGSWNADDDFNVWDGN
jgi:hypothetical protein